MESGVDESDTTQGLSLIFYESVNQLAFINIAIAMQSTNRQFYFVKMIRKLNTQHNVEVMI